MSVSSERLGRALRLSLLLFLILFGRPAPVLGTAPPLSGSPLPRELVEARASRLFSLSAPDSSSRAAGGSRHGGVHPDGGVIGTEGDWHVPVILVSFSDQSPAYPRPRFVTLLFDTTGTLPDGSVRQYYDQVSGRRLRLTGEVFGWYSLAHTRNFYAFDSYGVRRVGWPNNDAGLVMDAVKAADPNIDFTRFDRDGDGEVDVVFVVHVGLGAEAASGDRTQLWSINSSLSGGWDGVIPDTTKDLRPGSSTQYMMVNHFSILPERSGIHPDSLTEIGVYCHEFGHALGWPDLYDASTLGGGLNLGPGNWCLMATGAFGGDSRTPQRPVRPCAWAMMDAGWATVENLVRSGPLVAGPVEDTRQLYRLWWQGEASTEYYLLENRQRRGYDADVPGRGLLVYHVEDDVIASRRSSNRVNSGLIPGLRVEEADGRYDLRMSYTRGDEGDPFPGAEGASRFADDTSPPARSYAGRFTNVSLDRLAYDGDSVSAWVQLSPTGWTPPETQSVPGRLRPGDSRTLARLGPHLLLLAHDEADSGRVYAVSRAFNLSWGTPERVSSVGGPVEATWSDPTTGPLAALWTDRRDGMSEIYYRLWAPVRDGERRATYSPAFASHPGAAWMGGGRLGVVWLDTRAGKSQVFFKTFAVGDEESAPETVVSDRFVTPEVLDLAVAGSPDGDLFLAYTARGSGVDEVYWQRFHPGSGWSVPLQLSSRDGYPSGNPDLIRLSDGKVRVAWRDNGPTRTTVISVVYDPDDDSFVAALPDLFSSSFSLPLVRVGAGANPYDVTILARANDPPLDRILVARQHPDAAWDVGLGWISQGIEAGAGELALDVDAEGTATVISAIPGSTSTTIWTLRRPQNQATPVAVSDPAARWAPNRIQAFPNPAHDRVDFTWPSAPAGAGQAEGSKAFLAVYNPRGRRVARIGAGAGRVSWRGRDERGATLPSGIYLYRLEDDRGRALGASGKLVWLP